MICMTMQTVHNTNAYAQSPRVKLVQSNQISGHPVYWSDTWDLETKNSIHHQNLTKALQLLHEAAQVVTDADCIDPENIIVAYHCEVMHVDASVSKELKETTKQSPAQWIVPFALMVLYIPFLRTATIMKDKSIEMVRRLPAYNITDNTQFANLFNLKERRWLSSQDQLLRSFRYFLQHRNQREMLAKEITFTLNKFFDITLHRFDIDRVTVSNATYTLHFPDTYLKFDTQQRIANTFDLSPKMMHQFLLDASRLAGADAIHQYKRQLFNYNFELLRPESSHYKLSILDTRNAIFDRADVVANQHLMDTFSPEIKEKLSPKTHYFSPHAGKTDLYIKNIKRLYSRATLGAAAFVVGITAWLWWDEIEEQAQTILLDEERLFESNPSDLVPILDNHPAFTASLAMLWDEIHDAMK